MVESVACNRSVAINARAAIGVWGCSHKPFCLSGGGSRNRRGVHKRWAFPDKSSACLSVGRQKKRLVVEGGYGVAPGEECLVLSAMIATVAYQWGNYRARAWRVIDCNVRGRTKGAWSIGTEKSDGDRSASSVS